MALAVCLPPAMAQGRPAERAISAAPVAARIVEYHESRGANVLYLEERGGPAAPRKAAAPAKPPEPPPDSRRRLAAAGDGAAKR